MIVVLVLAIAIVIGPRAGCWASVSTSTAVDVDVPPYLSRSLTFYHFPQKEKFEFLCMGCIVLVVVENDYYLK